MTAIVLSFFFFFLNDTPTPEIYPLPLHAPLPIGRAFPPQCDACSSCSPRCSRRPTPRRSLRRCLRSGSRPAPSSDRKSTRLNSSHANISYAVFCLKKKKKHKNISTYLNANDTY